MSLFFKGLFNVAIMMRLSYPEPIDHRAQATARSLARFKKIRKIFSKSVMSARFSTLSASIAGAIRGATRRSRRVEKAPHDTSRCTPEFRCAWRKDGLLRTARQLRLASHRTSGHNF
jgi:hypothetical protein